MLKHIEKPVTVETLLLTWLQQRIAIIRPFEPGLHPAEQAERAEIVKALKAFVVKATTAEYARQN